MLAIAFMGLIEVEAETLGLGRGEFESFYDEALPQIYGYFVNRCGGTVAAAEDLTQETFLAAVAELRKGRRVEKPIAWLYGIARHKLLDHYRRESRWEAPLDADAELDEVSGETAIDDGGPEAHANVVCALAALVAPQRAVLVLFYLDGLTVVEIAGELGKSPAAVNSLLERGRVGFKRAYLKACS